MTKEFFEEVMRVPSVSQHEDMMIEFLLEWGKAHGCTTKRDAKGNVTMVKGKADGFYPCLANHMDTVHHDQTSLVRNKKYKEIVWKGDRVEAVNPDTKKTTGLGMDDQGGCAIALAVLERLPACKAIFVVEEEIGMQGSRAFDKHFLDDCAFVISNDSPDRNRATHYSSGTQLYSDKFFEEHLEKICKKHGVTSFRSEPFTDIIQYRRHTMPDGKHIECLNFGNGGYDPHRDTEYASFSDVNAAEELLYALCTEIPTDRQWTSDIGAEPRPTYSWSGYSGSSASSGYSDWWRNMASRKPSFTPRAEFVDSTKDDVWTFNWKFATGEANAKKFTERAGGLLSPDVKIDSIGADSVRVTGPKAKLKTAFRFAFNYDNDKKYMSWEQFANAEPGAETAFDKNVKKVEPEEDDEPLTAMERSDTDQCAISLYFSSEDNCTKFMDMAHTLRGIELDDDGFSTCTVLGDFGSVKQSYVIYLAIEDGSKAKTWKELVSSNPDAAQEFFDMVEFDDDGPSGMDADDVIDIEPDDIPPEDTEDGDGFWNWFD